MNENLNKSADKIGQSRFKSSTSNTKLTLKELPTTIKFCQNGEISPNLVTVISN